MCRHGCGNVKTEDLKEAMLQYGSVLSSEEVEDLFLHADSEGSGKFSYLDFIKKMMDN